MVHWLRTTSSKSDRAEEVSDEHQNFIAWAISAHHFDVQRGATGALMVGSSEEAAEKIHRHSKSFGGISRVTFQMDNAQMNHAQLMRSIELIGTRMSPLLND
ncbi:hypothetical protein ACQ4N7_29745 [Nodosilinea sp. AN01ver1]|uniref:hypothetical protein n=1 Tax=Nodosilinea sp. AN01ver1 TaxID=3423362 RepID=UPI003D31B8BD